MKKDWLEDIHDRMADFEVDVPRGSDQREQPQGLWEDICAAETSKQYRIWIGSSAAAAACLLLLWVMRPDFEQDTEVPALPAQEIASSDHRVSNEEQVLTEELSHQEKVLEHAEESVHAEKIAHTEQPIIAAATSEEKIEAKSAEEVKPAKETKPSEEAKPTEESKPTEDKKHPASKQEAPLTHYEYLAQTTHKHRNSDPRLSVGLSTSGGLGSDNRQLFQGGYAAGASTMLSESDWLDSPLLGIMALNRGAETERKVTHHAPIRTGLSFAYRLNDRWSIESGITYALVSSDIHEGSASNFIEQEQKLHYVGIPLGATYRLLSWKRLDLYLSSNILAEQCVSGQLRKKFIISNKAQGDEKTTTLHSRPMQWSVGAKAGVQYNLTPLLSLYAEPGCSYYFDDHSSLETVFKDKVFDFNLNLGLRFSVGQ